MAKKETLSSSRTDFDSNFDDFNFDFDAPEPKDDRSPVTKLAAGILSGAKTAAQSEAFIRQSVKSVLPEGYGLAMDLQDEVSKKSKELYNNAVKEVKPIVGAMSSAADKLLPAGAARLKAKIKNINDWSKNSEKAFSRNQKQDNEAASIAASITETFRFQMSQEAKESARTESREKLQEGLALTRHRDEFGMLNRINFGITKLTQYQDRVTAAYQKKSLELQYRSLFTSIDILQEAKRQNAYTSEALATITKNTGLPDFVKLTEGDRLEGVLRSKLSKAIGNSILSGKDNPVTVFNEHISKVFNDKLKDMTGILSSSADMLSMMAQGKDSVEGQDKFKVAGQMVGGEAAKLIRDKVSPYAKKYLPKSVVKNGSKIEGYVKNSTQYTDKFKSSSYGEKNGAAKALFFKTLKEFIPNFGVKTELEKDSIGDLNKPHVYTKQTHKTINEVIPGYLSRIFRELQVMRTGDTKIGLTLYDNKSNKFADSKVVSKNLLDSVVSKSGVESTKTQLDSIMDLVDPKNKLKPEARMALAKKTLSDNLSGKLGTADRTAHEFTYLDDETTKPHAKEITSVMQKFFKSNKSGKIKDTKESHDIQNSFTEKQRGLGKYISDARGQIQNLINLGNYESLEKLGLVDFKDDKAVVNQKKLVEYYTGGQYNPVEDVLSQSKQDATKKATIKGSIAARQQRPSTGFVSRPVERPQAEQPQQLPQQSSNADLLKALSDSSVKSEMTQSASLLDSIKEILLESNVSQEAYFTNLIDNVKAIGVSTSNGSSAGAPESKDNGNVFQGSSVNLKNFLGKTTKKLGSLFALGGKVGMSGIKLGGSVLGAGFSLGKKALNITGNILTKIGQKRELFVPGEDEPRIRTDLLRAGKYFNKKGKAFKSLDDINDTVYDESGTVVITKEELKTSYVRSTRGSGVFKIVKFAGNLLTDAAKFGTSLIPPVFKLAMDTAKFAFRTVTNLLDQPEDIYIKGSDVPVMIKRAMTAGHYFLKSDMSRVMKPSQIIGVIVNKDGDVVLTDLDLRTGIFDKYGKPIKTPLGRLLGLATGAATLGLKAIGFAARSGMKVLKTGIKAGGKVLGVGAKFLSGGVGSFTKPTQGNSDGLVGDSYKTLDVLERIFNVLDSRLPAKANRRGSWRDFEKKNGKNNKAADVIDATSKGSLGDGLLAKGKGLLDSITDRNSNKTISIENTKGPTATDATPKKGFFNKVKGFGKGLLGGKTGALLGMAGMLGLDAVTSGAQPGSIGSTVGKVADVAGAASTIYNIGKFVLPAAEVAGTVLGAGATTGGIVAAGTGVAAAEVAGATAVATGLGGAGIGASILTGLGALATGVGAILGSPVVLGALALAAVGTAGYFAYEYFKKQDYLKNLRYIQYGFSGKNTSGFGKSFLLEESLKDVIFFKEGIADIDNKKFDTKKALTLFGINADDAKAVGKWTYWFQQRFKPVFFTHLTALRTIDNKAKISDVDSLKPDQKDKFLELVKFQEGPYDLNTNPISGNSTQLTTGKDVDAYYQTARKAIDTEMKEKKDKTSSVGAAPNAGYDSMGNAISTTANSGSLVTGDTSKTGKEMSKDYSKDSSALNATKGVALAISGISAELSNSNLVDNLEGIRMRSYGLTTMEADKVGALRKLENLIISKVQYGGDGKAIYKADSIDTIVAGGMFFGVTTGSDLAASWNKWFQTRFLPVYLSYLGLVKQNAGAPLKAGTTPSLTALQALSIGTQISSLDATWSVTDSPWAQYKLGTDQSIVKELIESLRLNSKKTVMPEAVVVKNNMPSTPAPNSDPRANIVKDAIGNKGNASADKPSGGQDAENVEMNRAPVGSVESLNGTAGLSLAGGPLSDGRNASAYLRMATGATLQGLNPEFLKNFSGLVNEYGVLTGKSTLVNSGFRSSEKQAALYKADPTTAAPPGSSLHEYGLAVDVNQTILDEMDKIGLLRKYGFTRPVGGEPWHLEATGIQGNIAGFKKDQNLASQAIAAGIGKGGGGYGTMADSTKYKRNAGVAKQILDASIAPSKDEALKPVIPDKAQIAGTPQPGVPQALGTSTPTYDAMGNVTGSSDSEAKVVAGAAVGKTKAEMLGSAPNGRSANTNGAVVTATSTKSSIYGSSGGSSTGNMMPALQAVVPSTGGNYTSIPSPAGGSGWGNNKDMIVAAANAVGVDPKYMVAIGAIESGFDPSAKAPRGTASGLNQFVDGTWREQMRKNAGKYGIPANASALDPKANALLGAAYVKENLSTLSGVKSDITGTDVYMAHFLGGAGAKRFLGADPNALGSDILPDAAINNAGIFYNNGKPRTVGEIYALLNSRMQTKLQQFGVDQKYIPSTSGLVAKNTSTTGLEIRTPSIGLNANPVPVAAGPSLQNVDITGKPTDPTQKPQTSAPMAPMITPMTDIGGFNMQGVQQPLQNPKQDMNSALGDVGSTLAKSLDVQTKMLQALESIVKMNGMVSPMQQPLSNGKVQTVDQTPPKLDSQQLQDQAVKSYGITSSKMDVPVSMSRV